MEAENTKVTDVSENIDTEKPTRECSNCHAILEEEHMFCPKCGTPVKNVCTGCGRELIDGQMFCTSCGRKADNAVSINEKSANDSFKLLAVIIGALVAIGIIITIVVFCMNSGGTSSSYEEEEEYPISFREEFGNLETESWCEIAADDSYMKLDTNPYDLEDEYNSEANYTITVVNDRLGFSESVEAKMNETRALDGRQTEENDLYKVSWTYHPDNGLEVMYEKK